MNRLPPGLSGFVQGRQLNQQQGAQQLGMLAQLMNIQGQQQDRALQQQMMPLKMQGMLAELEERKARAQEATDKRAFFSPQNTQQYAGEGGQMNFDKFLQDAASRGFVNPETYANHQSQRALQGQQITAAHEARMAQLRATIEDRRQRAEDRTLSREQQATLRREAMALQQQLAQMNLQGRQDMARLTASLRQQAPGGGVKLSPTAQKEVFEADDTIQASQSAIQALQQAQALNDQAMGFAGAGLVAKAGTLLPEGMRPKTVDATNELDNLVTNSAVPQLKAIFGGNPTEGERKVLLEIAGSSSANPSVRKGIFERAIAMAQRRMQFNAQKAQSLRSGTYFTEGAPAAAPVAAPAATPVAPPKVRKYNPATGKIE
jgi:hypothetical protein